MFIERVISGGQTGADQAGWRAAKTAKIATGGWMPRGFRTESSCGQGDSYHPEFGELYGACEHEKFEYQPRTKLNVQESDGTLIFNRYQRVSSGSRLTLQTAIEYRKPCLVVVFLTRSWEPTHNPENITSWIKKNDIHILNIAGNRESRSKGIGVAVEKFLDHMFSYLQ